jgi:predicted nucleotidyltransferase
VIDVEKALRILSEADVEFIVAGGVAGTLLGSARLTMDLDVVYRRSPENLARLVTALAPHRPYLRGAPPGLPFRWDVETISRGLNFTLVTAVGDLDLLGELTGGGGYDDLLPRSVAISAHGLSLRVLGLDALIHVKRAAGRPKDLEAIAELEVIREERRKRGL